MDIMGSWSWSCAVCLDNFIRIASRPICLDDDNVCKQCLYNLFELALTDEAHYPSKWGSKIIHPADYKEIVGSEFLDTYKTKEREWKTTAAYRIYCSCGRFIGSKSYWPTIWCHSCSLCDTVACSSCRLIIGKKYEWQHHQCLNRRSLQAGGFDEAFEALVRGKDYQICPNNRCQRKVEHTEGCNHMVCRPGCGTHFCYRCGKESDLSSYHWTEGGCPLYTASSGTHAQYQEPVWLERRLAAEQVTHNWSDSPHDDMAYGWDFQVWAWNAAMQTKLARREQWLLLRGRSTEEDRARIHKVMHGYNVASHGVGLERWTSFSERYSGMTLPWLNELDAAVKRNEILPTGLLQHPVSHVINALTAEGVNVLKSWARQVAEMDDYRPLKNQSAEESLEIRRDTGYEEWQIDMGLTGISLQEPSQRDQRQKMAMLNVRPGDVWVGMGPHSNDEEARRGVRTLENLLRERTFDTRVVRDNFGLYIRTCCAIRHENQCTQTFQPPFNAYEVLDWTVTDVFDPDKLIMQTEDGFVRPRRLENAIDAMATGSWNMEYWSPGKRPEKLYSQRSPRPWSQHPIKTRYPLVDSMRSKSVRLG